MTGDGGEVLQERLAAVTEVRCLDRDGVDGLAHRVDHQRGQGLALDVLGDDHDRLALLDDLLQQRQQVRDRGDLVLVQQDVGVLENGFLVVGVSDEVSGDPALVELDALGHVELGGHRRGLLDGDHTVLADPLDGLAEQRADRRVPGCDGADLRDVVAALDRRRVLLEGLDDGLAGRVHAPAERRRVGTGGDVEQAEANHRLSQHGRRGGAVACHVIGLRGDVLRELGTQVLERVLQVDLAGDGHAVVGDGGATELLVEHDVPAARTQRHLDRVGQFVDAALQCPTSVLVETDLLGHRLPF
jgi:hypothetical protein